MDALDAELTAAEALVVRRRLARAVSLPPRRSANACPPFCGGCAPKAVQSMASSGGASSRHQVEGFLEEAANQLLLCGQQVAFADGELSLARVMAEARALASRWRGLQSKVQPVRRGNLGADHHGQLVVPNSDPSQVASAFRAHAPAFLAAWLDICDNTAEALGISLERWTGRLAEEDSPDFVLCSTARDLPRAV